MNHRDKWINIIYKVATSSGKVRSLLTPLSSILFFTLEALYIVLALRIDEILGLPKLFSTPFNLIVSVPFLAMGLFLTVWSILHFVRAKGTPMPFNPPPNLVTTGPYAHVRNPIVAGGAISLIGLGILFGSVSLVFAFAPLIILLNVLELMAIEEPELEKRLGRQYLEYKKTVPMFVPLAGCRRTMKSRF